YQLFGRFLIDYSMASATGLFDIRALNWDDGALAFAGITKDYLSQPVLPTHVETALKEEYRTLFSFQTKVPFMIGASDGALANLGSGAIRPGEVSLTIGTSGAVRVFSQQPLADTKGRLFNYLVTDNWYISGG